MFQAGARHCGRAGRAPLPAKRIALDKLCGTHGVRALLPTKYIEDGNVVARFEPTADMKKVEECVASLI